MKKIVVLFLCLGLLVLGCSKKITNPVKEGELSFVILDCAKADEFFQTKENSFIKPTGYYACACLEESNAFVEINIALPEDTHVHLVIKNATGYEIKILVDEMLSAGYKTVTWDGKNEKGDTVKSGIYIASLRTGTGYKAEIFVVLKG
jgi:hypothetical protein